MSKMKIYNGTSWEILQGGKTVEAYNVKEFGATGNGTTDDTSAIQSALDATVSGDIVFIPSGTYKVTQLTISNKSNIKIIGSGQLKGSADTIGVSIFGVIYITNSSDIEIKELNISGMFSGTDDRGIWIADSHNVTVQNCRFTNFGQEALLLWGANDATESTNHILDNYILGNNFGIKLEVNGEYWQIDRNKIINNNWGIYGGLGNCRIDNNIVMLNGYGVVLDGSQGTNPDHCAISNNQINHNKNVGLFVENLTSGEQIIGNEILSTTGGTWPTTGKPHSLVMINVVDVAFIGNRVDADSTTSSYIYIDGHEECRYIGNTFHGGEVKEVSAATGKNVYIGNRYLNPSKLTLHASSPTPIRVAEIEQGAYVNDTSSTIIKTAATYLNGWSTAAGYQDLSYWKDSEGNVHIQGSITGGTAGSNIMTLPSDMWPASAVDIVGSANNSGDHCSFRVYANGNVQQLSGGTTLLSLSAQFKP